MARTLLVVPTAAGVGLARTCLGLVRALDRRGVNVAFVKPVAQPRADGGPDRSTALVAATTALHPPEPIPAGQLEQQLGAGGLDVVLETIVAAWQPVPDRSDVLLVASWPVAGRGGGEDRADRTAQPELDPTTGTVEAVAETLAITASGYWSGEHARVVGCVVNGLPADDPSRAVRLVGALAERGLRSIGAVPHRPELTWLRVRDLVRELNPRVLSEGDLSRRIKEVAVFAQGVPGGLRVLTEGRLIVVPGDRHDVVMAACLAELSGIRLAALLLSVGTEPDPRVWELTRATRATGLPILVVDDNSYEP